MDHEQVEKGHSGGFPSGSHGSNHPSNVASEATSSQPINDNIEEYMDNASAAVPRISYNDPDALTAITGRTRRTAPRQPNLTYVDGCEFAVERMSAPPQAYTMNMFPNGAHCKRCFGLKHGICARVCRCCGGANSHLGVTCPSVYGTVNQYNKKLGMFPDKIPEYLQVRPSALEQARLVEAGYLAHVCATDHGPLAGTQAAIDLQNAYPRPPPTAPVQRKFATPRTHHNKPKDSPFTFTPAFPPPAPSPFLAPDPVSRSTTEQSRTGQKHGADNDELVREVKRLRNALEESESARRDGEMARREDEIEFRRLLDEEREYTRKIHENAQHSGAKADRERARSTALEKRFHDERLIREQMTPIRRAPTAAYQPPTTGSRPPASASHPHATGSRPLPTGSRPFSTRPYQQWGAHRSPRYPSHAAQAVDSVDAAALADLDAQEREMMDPMDAAALADLDAQESEMRKRDFQMFDYPPRQSYGHSYGTLYESRSAPGNVGGLTDSTYAPRNSNTQLQGERREGRRWAGRGRQQEH
ncbi:hypothetical protein P154DRAFT_533913 [Amniculicola lignicola CBS 123094]|uniref:Uncharacterized protein n=1 Tax=Amniculicola lignicola CBS 123094 TaxID=1392246 RepID=A0A6A5WMI4_9PLEO|nr:hypothetical protein P154DRAFT_533913 [Amniculicola lignicola CBS 123094]